MLAGRLHCVSAERITEEITKLLAAPQPGSWLEPVVFASVLPELFAPRLRNSFGQARVVVDALPAGEEEVAARFAALLLPLGEEGVRTALRRLHCSNALIDETATLVQTQKKLRPALPGAARVQARRLLGRLELPTLCRVSQLAVNGRDLMALGVQPGPGLRRILETLLEQVITDALPNEREALLARAAQTMAS